MELPSRDPFKRLKEILRSSKYQVINTPKRMNFQALDKLLRKACLPMLVSLEPQIGETTYKHVIGICPNEPNDGDEIRYFIVDGSHPKLKAIDFSLENLNWCCGGENSFSVVSEGILFFPTAVRTKQIIENWSTLYHTMEDIQHAGISVCLSIEKVYSKYIPEHVGALNIVSRTKREIDAIVKEDRECIRN